jgi:response regulator NasT
MKPVESASAKPLRVLVVEDDTLVAMGLRMHLEHAGHTVLGPVATAEEAKQIFAADHPSLVMVDIRLADADGIDLAEELLAARRVPVIVITAYGDTELIERAVAAGVFGYLVKPVTREAVLGQVQVAMNRFAEFEQLRDQNQALQQSLETRKLVERAKLILMRRQNLTEPEAHRRLQVESQNRRIGLPEIARRIIESEELLGP